MTTEAMQEMTAGRESDAMIAETVMGWRWMVAPISGLRWLAPPEHQQENTHQRRADGTEPTEAAWWLCATPPARELEVVPHFTTNLADAWTVVEKIGKDALVILKWFPVTEQYECAMWLARPASSPTAADGGETAPLAVCRTALRHVRLNPGAFAEPPASAGAPS